MAEEVRTLRQTVSELEAYTVELELQIGALEQQLDLANDQLNQQHGVASARAHEDSRRLELLLRENETTGHEVTELHQRVAALSETNDDLSRANATLSEQVRRLRGDRKTVAGGRTFTDLLSAANKEAAAEDSAGGAAAAGAADSARPVHALGGPGAVVAAQGSTSAVEGAAKSRSPVAGCGSMEVALALAAPGAPSLRPRSAAQAAAVDVEGLGRPPLGACSAAAAAAAAKSEAELAQRLGELNETLRRDRYEDERAALTLSAPGASDVAAACKASPMTGSAEDSSGVMDEDGPGVTGSYARSSTHTHGSLGSARLNELQRITDAIRSGQPLHQVLEDRDQEPMPARTAKAQKIAAAFASSEFGVGSAASSERLLALSSRPLGQRSARLAPDDAEGDVAEELAEVAVAKARIGLVGEEEGSGEDGSVDGEDEGEDGVEEPGSEEPEDTHAASGEEGALDDTTDDPQKHSSSDEEGDAEDRGGSCTNTKLSAASRQAARNRPPLKTRVQIALAKRKELPPSAWTARGARRGDGGDGRIVSAVAAQKPSRLRSLLEQEVACQNAVAASLAGASSS